MAFGKKKDSGKQSLMELPCKCGAACLITGLEVSRIFRIYQLCEGSGDSGA